MSDLSKQNPAVILDRIQKAVTRLDIATIQRATESYADALSIDIKGDADDPGGPTIRVEIVWSRKSKLLAPRNAVSNHIRSTSHDGLPF